MTTSEVTSPFSFMYLITIYSKKIHSAASELDFEGKLEYPGLPYSASVVGTLQLDSVWTDLKLKHPDSLGFVP